MKIGDLVRANDDVPGIISEKGDACWHPGSLGLIAAGADCVEPRLYKVKSGVDGFHAWEKEMTVIRSHNEAGETK